jgi:PBSX family phage terminase large subunit
MHRTVELTGPQHDFFCDTAKFKAFISGIGAGKTVIGWLQAIREASEQPGSRGLIVAPTYTLIKDVIWWEMDRWLPQEVVREFSENKKVLKFTNGSEILFRSADNPRHIERLRGLSIAWFWIDECSLLPKLVWDILIGRLRQPEYEYKAWITGTPKGFNWIYDLFVENPTPDSFILYNVPTSSNIFLPKKYIKSLEQQYKGQFALQELGGKFVKFEGLVYPGFSVPKHVVDLLPTVFERIIYGVDWGFRNPACILALGIKGDEVFIIQEYYAPKTTDDELIEVAKQMQQKWGVGKFFCDPSEPASIEKFKRVGIAAEKANNDVMAGIKAVTTHVESDKLLIHSRCQNTINEFQMYRYDDNDKETPIKINDHAMDALRYATMGLSKTAPTHGLADMLITGGRKHI